MTTQPMASSETAGSCGTLAATTNPAIAANGSSTKPRRSSSAARTESANPVDRAFVRAVRGGNITGTVGSGGAPV